MPLHRDIHWIGRQWAVTGHGMQLIDQKLKGFFDIETSQLWEEALMETMRAKEWLNRADFDKGLEVARKRFPKDGVAPPPPAEPSPAPEKIAPAVLPVAPAIAPKPVVQAALAIAPVVPPSVVAPPIAPIEPAPEVNKPAEKPASPLRLRIDPVSPPPAQKSAAPKPPAAKSPAAKSPAAKSPDAKPPVLPLPPPGTLQASLIPTPEPKAKPLLPIFQMLFSGEAKFVRPWRVRVRK